MATNVGFKGISVFQSGSALLLRALLQGSGGALVINGTTTLRIYELQSDGSLKTLDFNTNAFTAGQVTTPSVNMNYQKSANGTVDTGLWTYAQTVLSGFTIGGLYLAHTTNSGAFPADQLREFQFGSAEGDEVVTATGAGTGAVLSNLNLAQAVPVSNTAQTVGDSLNAARVQGFGPWTWTTVAGNASLSQLVLYNSDGSVARSFTINCPVPNGGNVPTSRS